MGEDTKCLAPVGGGGEKRYFRSLGKVSKCPADLAGGGEIF